MCICGRARNTTGFNLCGRCEHSCQVLCFRTAQNKIRSVHSFCYTLRSTQCVSEPLLSTCENRYSQQLLLDSFYFQIIPLLAFWEIVQSVCYVCFVKFYLFATFWDEACSSLGFVILQDSHNGDFFKTHESAQSLRSSLLGLIKEN